jgi:RNA polymerase sigma-70 factor (ECF subfamily)
MRSDVGTDIEAIAAGGDHHSDPGEHYDFRRKREELLSAMETLPPKTRSMLLLHYFHGFKYEAIAEILETKVGSVRVAVHRGRRALRDLLSGSNMDARREGRYENAMQ